jgi:hypothetical protein
LVSGTDIRIEAGSALPQSKAAKQALLMDMMKMGFIPAEEGLKLMEIGGAQKIFERMRVDERQAQRENIRLRSVTVPMIQEHEMGWQQKVMQQDPSTIDEQGNPIQTPPVVPVNTYDNHAVHIDVHNRYRRSQGFEILPDDVKMQFEAHVQMHTMAMQQAQIEQFMAAMPGDGTEQQDGGAPPGPGGVESGGQPLGPGMSGVTDAIQQQQQPTMGA